MLKTSTVKNRARHFFFTGETSCSSWFISITLHFLQFLTLQSCKRVNPTNRKSQNFCSENAQRIHEIIPWCCSVIQLCPTLCDPSGSSTLGLPVHHQLQELAQTHIHWVSDAIQPSHPLLSPSLPAFSLSQHQGLFQWVYSSHQVAKVSELQLQHQAFQWIFKVDFL